MYHHGAVDIAATLDFSGATPVVTRRDTPPIKGNRADIEPHSDKTLILGEPEDMRIVVVPNWLNRVRARLRGH